MRRATAKPYEPGTRHFYDQIAWFEEDSTRSVRTLDFVRAGSFDFVPLLQGEETKTALFWRVSDHYPLWVEFSVRPTRLDTFHA